MTAPNIAQKAPYRIEVEAGKTYYWCSCGLSQKQPLCDGAHKGSSFVPVAYVPEQTGSAALCGCKLSSKQPLCDGIHKTL